MKRQKNSKWPDYLFSVAVRAFFGAPAGVFLAMFFILHGRGIAAHLFAKDSLFWLAAAAVTGAIIGVIVAVCTIPDWQTPWYKSEYELAREEPEANETDDSAM